MADKPKHACQMALTIGGHTRQDIADVLLDLAVRVGNDDLGVQGFGGGPGGSYDFKLSIGDTPSFREYHNQLRDWLDEQKAARDGAGMPSVVEAADAGGVSERVTAADPQRNEGGA